jgi:hypothetical protein
LTLRDELGSFAPGFLNIRFLTSGGSMEGKSRSPITRREFARRAAIVPAATMVPARALAADSPAAALPFPQTPDSPSLSAEGKAEAEARYQAILAVYGSRFSETQKADLRRLSYAAQEPLDRLRVYSIENGDGPALYLKPLVEREKKPEGVAAPHTAETAPKQP